MQAQLSTRWDYLWPVLVFMALSLWVSWLRVRLGLTSSHGMAMLCLACLFGTVGTMAFASVGLRALIYQESVLPQELQGVDMQVTGTVASLPQRQAEGWRFRFEVLQAYRSDTLAQVQLPPLLQLGWYANDSSKLAQLPPLRAGQIWRLPLRLKQPHGLVNPGGFDTELWLWEQGIHATGYVRDGAHDPPAVRLQATWEHPIELLRQNLRSRIQQEVIEPRWSGLIAGLLIGDQAAIEHADWDVFRLTGIAHLMSISGLHITLWACVARWLVWRLWRYSEWWGQSWCLRYPAPLAAWWGGVVLATLYAVLSGWGVPAQRTVAMLALAVVLRVRASRWPLLTQWLMAAVLVVLIDPWALMQAGFWLSFIAVGILFLSTHAVGANTVESPTVIANAVLAGAAKQTQLLLREQVLISICLAPLSVILFQQISIIGLFVNLLAIPWVTLVVTPLAFMGVIWSPLWQLCSLSLQLMCDLLNPLSQLPWAVWHVAAPPWWVGAVGMVAGAVLASATTWSWRGVGLCLLMPCFGWPVQRPSHAQVEVIAADIGQGNAVLVRTAHHSLMFDTGPRLGFDSDAGQRVLLPLLQTMNEKLDILVLSHQDSDHTGGALSVYQMQPQSKVLTSIAPEHWMASKIPLQRCQAGQHWEWDGVLFTMLHPLSQDYQHVLSPNARSCVLRISAAGQVVLLTADIEAFQEQALVQRASDQLRADVLLVPHHGSKTSSTEAFLDAVQPRWALFQMGYRNRYGHPAPQVLARYINRHIAVKLSPACGAMTWRSENPAQVRCMREENRRYWQYPFSQVND